VSEDAFCALFQLPLQGATAATAGRRLAVHEKWRRPVGHGRTGGGGGGGGGEGEGFWFSRQRRRRGWILVFQILVTRSIPYKVILKIYKTIHRKIIKHKI
jgi:hypothetical protein